MGTRRTVYRIEMYGARSERDHGELLHDPNNARYTEVVILAIFVHE